MTCDCESEVERETIIAVSAPYYVPRKHCTDVERRPGWYVYVERKGFDEFYGAYGDRERARQMTDRMLAELRAQPDQENRG